MKLLRTSFSHLVREKIIQGQSQLWPEPADVPIENLISNVSAHTGKFEYQSDNHTETGLQTGNYYNQGAMGYGDPPIGPGTKPYMSFLSNKTKNLNALEVGIMTGDPSVTPSISIENVSYKGFGATFAVGQPQQYRYIELDNQLDCQAGFGKHVLFSISGLKGSVGDYTSAGWGGESDNVLNFVYETTGEVEYKVYVERADGTLISTPQTYSHFVNSYGRLMPISIFLDETGNGTFRVDNSTTTFSINTMTDKDALNYGMPTAGSLGLKISGLTPHVDIAEFGMTATISRLTNVAVNDNDDTDGCGDVGLPPFIHGITCSPIRGAESPDSAEWEFPSLVHSTTGKWTAFSENNPTVSYGLSAIMDNQTFDTRGVATDSLSADLEIYLTQDSIANKIAGANVTNTIEAINIKAYNAATFNQSQLAVKIHDTTDNWDTDWTEFPGLYDDPEVDSHVTFFSKLSGGETCHDFEFSDFEQDMVIKLRAQNPLVDGGGDSQNEGGGIDPPDDGGASDDGGGVFVNKFTNYLFHNCIPTTGVGPGYYHYSVDSIASKVGPHKSEFSRNGSIMLRMFTPVTNGEPAAVYLNEVEFDDTGVVLDSPPIARLQSNLATGYWGKSGCISDDGTVIAVADIGVTNASGGHGVVVMHKLSLDTSTVNETHVITPPLTNNDYTIDQTAGSKDYESLSQRNMHVDMSGDGKTVVIQFAQNYTAANPKSIFIYNLNESTQQYDLVQTINGIGYNDIKLCKDGSTLAVICGYFPATSLTGTTHVPGELEAGDYLGDSETYDSLYFHGLKIFRKNGQGEFVENTSLSIFDLGIEEAVKTPDIDWSMPISNAFGYLFDISRDGSAIMYQLPDRMGVAGIGNGNARTWLEPIRSQQGLGWDWTGPVAVITWDGTDWTKLGGNFLYDNGNDGFHFLRNHIGSGGISEDGTLLMLPSRNFYDDSTGLYTVNINFMKWNGSSWSKMSKIIHQDNDRAVETGWYSMSKQPHPAVNSLVGGMHANARNRDSLKLICTFSPECSTELIG